MIASGPASGPFSTIAGLPLQPLVVHAAVVLLPLSAIAVLVLLVRPRWRRAYGWLVVAAVVLGAVAAFVAKLSGDALAEQVGRPGDHALWGDRLWILAIVFAVLCVAWWVLDRRSPSPGVGPDSQAGDAGAGNPLAGRLLGAGAGALSLAVLVVTVVVGHSGATAVWGGTGLEAASPADPPPLAGEGPGAAEPPTTADADGPTSAEADSPPVYSLAEIAEHGSDQSCWVAISGQVYDLTDWIGQHPGGAGEILGVCGTDASAAFADEHDDDQRPHQELARFLIGTVG